MSLSESLLELLVKKADFRRFSRFLGTIVGSIGNPIIPLDRARRVVFGTRLEHLKHVPKRIPAGISSKKADFRRFSGFWETIVESIGNPIIPLNRAHRVVLGNHLKHLSHVPKRIPAGITIISQKFLL
jgi:hypothetical protein